MFLAVDGAQTFCHTGGVPLDTADGVVVLLHGAANNHTVWRYQTRRLAERGLPVVAPDLPAHGRSDGDIRTDIAAWSRWLGHLLDAMDAPSAVLVGHSMGSLISLQHAADAPSRTRAVAMLCTSPQMAVHRDLLDAADRQDQLAIDLIVGWTHTGASRVGGHRQAGVWNRVLTTRLLEQDLAALGTDLRTVADYDATEAAATVAASAVRTLVMGGGADRMTPSRAGAAMAQMLDARYELIPGYGHAMHYDAPVEVNATLVPWVDQHARRPS